LASIVVSIGIANASDNAEIAGGNKRGLDKGAFEKLTIFVKHTRKKETGFATQNAPSATKFSPALVNSRQQM